MDLNHHFPVGAFPDHHLDARHGWTSTLVQHSRRVLPNGRHTPSKETAIAAVPLIGAENDGIWWAVGGRGSRYGTMKRRRASTSRRGDFQI